MINRTTILINYGKIYSMPAIENSESEILILGTIPGGESLKYQQYYQNKDNLSCLEFEILIGLFLKKFMLFLMKRENSYC